MSLIQSLIPGTGGTVASLGGSDPRSEYWLLEDFTGNTPNPGETGMSSAVINSATAAMYGGVEMDKDHPGVVALTMNALSNAAAGVNRSNNTGFIFGGGVATLEALVRLSALSDGTDTYAFRVGFLNTQTTEPTNGVYFEYDSPVSANWRMVAATNSARTKTTTSTAVAAAAWLRAKIVVYAAGDGADFYINDALIGSLGSSNIPTVTPRFSHMGLQMIKSAGTTSRYALCDYIWTHIAFTTRR